MTKIYVVKYIPDPRRWEPHNVGVLVVNEQKQAGKFIGENADGSVDRQLAQRLVNDVEVYEQWVKYWRRTLAEGEIDSLLSSTTSLHYWIAEAGERWRGREEPEDLVEKYYARLVEECPA